jgi:hypothetical protein
VCAERQNILQLKQVKVLDANGTDLVDAGGAFAYGSDPVSLAYRPELVMNPYSSSIKVRLYRAESVGMMLSLCVSVSNETAIDSISLSNADSIPNFASNTLRYGSLKVYDWFGGLYYSSEIDFDYGTAIYSLRSPPAPSSSGIPLGNVFLQYEMISTDGLSVNGSYLIRRGTGIQIITGDIQAYVPGGNASTGMNVSAAHSYGNILNSQQFPSLPLNSELVLAYRIVDSSARVLSNYSLKINTLFTPSENATLSGVSKLTIALNSTSLLFTVAGVQICSTHVKVLSSLTLGNVFVYNLGDGGGSSVIDTCLRGSFDTSSSDELVVDTGIALVETHPGNTQSGAILAPKFSLSFSIGTGANKITQKTSFGLPGQFSVKADGMTIISLISLIIDHQGVSTLLGMLISQPLQES